ncbi:MAG: hypothetical protein ACKOXM_01630 [Agromyces sp.]
MQLGTRWPAGGQPPARLSDDWVAAIRTAEANGCDLGSWTLTWLEGYPRIVHDSGIEIGIGGTPLPEGGKSAGNDDGDDW